MTMRTYAIAVLKKERKLEKGGDKHLPQATLLSSVSARAYLTVSVLSGGHVTG